MRQVIKEVECRYLVNIENVNDNKIYAALFSDIPHILSVLPYKFSSDKEYTWIPIERTNQWRSGLYSTVSDAISGEIKKGVKIYEFDNVEELALWLITC